MKLSSSFSGILVFRPCLLLPQGGSAQKCTGEPKCMRPQSTSSVPRSLCGRLCTRMNYCSRDGVCTDLYGNEAPCDPVSDSPYNECGDEYCSDDCQCDSASKTCVAVYSCVDVQKDECPASIPSGACTEADYCATPLFTCEVFPARQRGRVEQVNFVCLAKSDAPPTGPTNPSVPPSSPGTGIRAVPSLAAVLVGSAMLFAIAMS